MKLLIYSPQYTGHHFAYLARLLPAVVELPIDIQLLTTPEAVASDEYESIRSFETRILVSPDLTYSGGTALANGLFRYRQLRDSLKKHRPDHVFITYADGLWPLVAIDAILRCPSWKPGCVVEGWVYRGGFAYDNRRRLADPVKRWLMKRLLAAGRFGRLHIDDELAFDYASHAAKSVGSTTRLTLTPNPVEIRPLATTGEARERLGIGRVAGRLVTSSGMITGWKGMHLVLRGFARMLETPAAQPGDTLLLAGPHEQAILSLYREPPYAKLIEQGRLIYIDRYLSTSEMFDVAAAGNLTLALYPDHSGRSSIILWAAAAGRPSLGTSTGCIGHVIDCQSLGWTVDPRDTDTVAKQMGGALGSDWTDEQAQRARAYAMTHSLEKYQESGSSMLKARFRQTG